MSAHRLNNRWRNGRPSHGARTGLEPVVVWRYGGKQPPPRLGTRAPANPGGISRTIWAISLQIPFSVYAYKVHVTVGGGVRWRIVLGNDALRQCRRDRGSATADVVLIAHPVQGGLGGKTWNGHDSPSSTRLAV